MHSKLVLRLLDGPFVSFGRVYSPEHKKQIVIDVLGSLMVLVKNIDVLKRLAKLI